MGKMFAAILDLAVRKVRTYGSQDRMMRKALAATVCVLGFAVTTHVEAPPPGTRGGPPVDSRGRPVHTVPPVEVPPPETAQKGDVIVITTEGNPIELSVFLEIIGQYLQKRIIYNPTDVPQGEQIMLSGVTEIALENAYAILENILQQRGLTFVERKGTLFVTSVVQEPTRRTADIILPDELARLPEDTGAVVTLVRELEHIRPSEAASYIEPYVLTADAVQVLDEYKMLVITDYYTNIKRIEKLLRALDKETREFEIVKLEYAAPQEVVDIIESILGAGVEPVAGQPTTSPAAEARRRLLERHRAQRGPPGPGGIPVPSGPRIISRTTTPSAGIPLQVHVYDPTNSVIVYGVREEIDRVKELIGYLDVKPDLSALTIYRLQHAAAEEVAKVLSEILGQRSPTEPGAPKTSQGGIAVADEGTNSVIVRADRDQQQEIKTLVEELDRPRGQVLIEATVVDISDSDLFDLGVELEYLNIARRTGGFGRSAFGLSSISEGETPANGEAKTSSSPRTPAGLFSTSLGFSGAIVLEGGDRVPAILAALKTVTEARISSMPQVVANDNEDATLSSTAQEPYSQFSQGDATTQEAFAGYQEAGTTLRITPHISIGETPQGETFRHLKLAITVEVSSFTGEGSASLPPPRLEDKMETTVTVPDNSTIIIGGLVTERESKTVDKVPLLGDIPFLGMLFRSTSTSKSHSYIYIFINARIFDTGEDMVDYSTERNLERAERQTSVDTEAWP